MKTVAVGLSGGVDSTLSALLLREQGYKVIGLSMSIYNTDIPISTSDKNACYGHFEKKDLKDIQKWGKNNHIKTYLLDLSEAYKKQILSYFQQAYLSGETPNPCIQCNTLMKFGLLIEEARKQGIQFDYFATGHYVRAARYNNRLTLRCGADLKKDQSYFLYRLTKEQLVHTLFPLGELTKEQTRQMARERGLAVADKADSQDFYAGDYADLLNQKPRIGQIVLSSGKVLGEHNGFWNYTIGQRKGLGIAYPEPLFVIDIDATHNRVIVGTKEETLQTSCTATDCVWMGLEKAPKQPMPVLAKYRSAGQWVPATIQTNGTDVFVQFDTPQKALTRGQSVVFYENDLILGGGIIK